MAINHSSETYGIKEIKGDVWLHHDKASQLISGEGHSIAIGDAIVTAPSAEVTIELSNHQQIRLGSPNKEVLIFDHAVQDLAHDTNEVAIERSSLNILSNISPNLALDNDISLSTLLDPSNTGFFSDHEDAALTYHNHHQQDETRSLTHIEVRDVISDFNVATDRFLLPFSGSIALGSNDFSEAQNKVQLSNLAIAFHRIDDYGYVSFKDIHGQDITLNETNMLYSVIDYLNQNFNGRAGDTLMFKVANDSYIYHFHPEAYAQQFGLTKFEGLAFDGLSQNFDSQLGNYLHIDFS